MRMLVGVGIFHKEFKLSTIERVANGLSLLDEAFAQIVFLVFEGTVMAIRVVAALSEKRMRRPRTTATAQGGVFTGLAKAPQMCGSLFRFSPEIEVEFFSFCDDFTQRTFTDVPACISNRRK